MTESLNDVQMLPLPVLRAEFAIRFLGWQVFPYDMHHVPGLCVEGTGCALVPPGKKPHVATIETLPAFDAAQLMGAGIKIGPALEAVFTDLYLLCEASPSPSGMTNWLRACVAQASRLERMGVPEFVLPPETVARMALLYNRLSTGAKHVQA